MNENCFPQPQREAEEETQKEQRRINLKYFPSSIYDQEKKVTNEKHDFITTPSFRTAETLQPRIIIEKTEISDEIIENHKKLEVLEKRIRSFPDIYGVQTESVAETYITFPGFEIYPNEFYLNQNYDDKFTPLSVPAFWEPRVYDRPEENMSNEKSEKLESKINEKLDIVLVDKPERLNGRYQKRLMRMFDEEDERTAAFDEEKNRNMEREREKSRKRDMYKLYEEDIQQQIISVPSQRRKRLVCIEWSKSVNLTESSSEDTEPYDFVL